MTTLTDILIVEDDTSVLAMYMASFSAFTKYSFLTAASGEEVEALLKDYVFKLGIIDIKLPGKMTGVDIGIMLKQHQPSMILYAMTGLAYIFTDFDPALAGFKKCFSKPSEFGLLLDSIKSELG